jgi:tRNA-Thr(GGU) m(6)t(6)A37 methyltransferase TsaA
MIFSFKPIGTVHSPFKSAGEIRQEDYWTPDGFDRIEGRLEIFPEFMKGLEHIDGFSHVIVLFAFHAAGEGKLTARPPFESDAKGVFATRSPRRPNPLGLTVVRVLERRENNIRIAGVDMIEGTPVLDVKPYTSRDLKPDARFGWLEKTCR